MSDQEMDDQLDKEFRELEFFEPSMRFSKNVLEQVKQESKLLRPERGALYWIPRVCIGSAAAVFVLTIVLLLVNRNSLPEVSLTEQMSQSFTAISLAIGGLVVYWLLDTVFRKTLVR